MVMSVWFEGASEIRCGIEQVKRSLDDLGAHHADVVSLMPGLTSVVLVEQGSDSVTIRTNEGLMKRTNIAKRVEAERVVVELDEEYAAGYKVTTTSHFVHEFTPSGTGVSHRMVISDVEAPGFLGFFYRRFGSSKMGKAFLRAYKVYFEDQGPVS